MTHSNNLTDKPSDEELQEVGKFGLAALERSGIATDTTSNLANLHGESGENGETHRNASQVGDSNTSRSRKKRGETAVRMVRNSNFEESEGSIYYLTVQTSDDGKKFVKRTRLMTGITMVAQARDKRSEQWGLVLEVVDPSQVTHTLITPRQWLIGDGNELLSRLMDLGADLAAGRDTSKKIIEYFHTVKTEKFARHVDNTGWYGRVFVLPERVIGDSGNELVLLQAPAADIGTAESGTLSDWQTKVAAYAIANSRLILTISMNFAGALLEITKAEGGGVNLVHTSTCGKTTAARVGGSTWGNHDFIKTMRSTSNGIEGMFKLHNDLCMTADELGMVSPDELGSIIYMSTTGRGKARSKRDGSPRKIDSFKLVLITTGEKTVSQHMASKGIKTAAGQEIRLVDFPADAGAGYGVFQDLHGFETAAKFAGYLNEVTNQFYGTAGVEFLNKLAAGNLDEILQGIKKIRAEWETRYIPANSAAQVQRVGRRFSLYVAAGELATAFKVTGWPAETAFNSIGKCFQNWLEYRGNADDLEHSNLLAAVRLFFEQHGDSRFPIIDESDAANKPDEARTINRAGFRKRKGDDVEFLVLPEVFGNELLKGFNRTWAIGILKEAGWLKPDPATDRPDQSRHIPGLGNKRVYVFSSAVFEAGDT